MQPSPATGSIGHGDTRIAAKVSAILRSLSGGGLGGPGDIANLTAAYAGDAPNDVQGVTQINLQLPAAFPARQNLLYLTIGNGVAPVASLWVTPALAPIGFGSLAASSFLKLRNKATGGPWNNEDGGAGLGWECLFHILS